MIPELIVTESGILDYHDSLIPCPAPLDCQSASHRNNNIFQGVPVPNDSRIVCNRVGIIEL